jgi:hypothetical protein
LRRSYSTTARCSSTPHTRTTWFASAPLSACARRIPNPSRGRSNVEGANPPFYNLGKTACRSARLHFSNRPCVLAASACSGCGGAREPVFVRAAAGDRHDSDPVLRGGSVAPIRSERRRYHCHHCSSGKRLASQADELNVVAGNRDQRRMVVTPPLDMVAGDAIIEVLVDSRVHPRPKTDTPPAPLPNSG